ncbi:hypothetical protein LRP52_47280 [Photobacterium sp. ZSDE20]|nr:hypothetical protein [Photobacterium sp. ZSDE20]
MTQIRIRFHAVGPATEQDTEQRRTGICPSLGISEQPGFTPGGYRPDIPLHTVVAYWVIAILNIPFKVASLL